MRRPLGSTWLALGWISLLSACATPSTVSLPGQDVVAERSAALQELSRLPPPVAYVENGDTLRIVRDAQSPVERNEATMYQVRSDGGFSYPDIGVIYAARRTPEEIGDEITQKLGKIYRYPKVTVNIAIAPGNRIFVGGAVRNPSALELNGVASLEQALIAAGGVLPTADSGHIALLRTDTKGDYHVYFTDYSQLLSPMPARKPVPLQRGDVIFVPKSVVGNAIEVVDLYLNQLIPFSKYIGIGFNYDLQTRNLE
jgi:protein involved in polysaccharide export with SLBB domain